MTTSISKPLSHAEQIFYDLVWTPMIMTGENYLEAQVPFLKLPVFDQLDHLAITMLTDWMFEQMKLFIDLTAIKLLNAAHQSAYDQASLELAIIAQEKGITSDEFKKARDVARAALSQFTQYAH